MGREALSSPPTRPRPEARALRVQEGSRTPPRAACGLGLAVLVGTRTTLLLVADGVKSSVGKGLLRWVHGQASIR